MAPRRPVATGRKNEFGEWLFADWIGLGAKLAHFLLYVLLIAVPVAGIILQFARGDSLSIFGLVDMASPWVRDRAFVEEVKEVHELLAHSLLAVAALHAAAALVHHSFFWRPHAGSDAARLEGVTVTTQLTVTFCRIDSMGGRVHSAPHSDSEIPVSLM